MNMLQAVRQHPGWRLVGLLRFDTTEQFLLDLNCVNNCVSVLLFREHLRYKPDTGGRADDDNRVKPSGAALFQSCLVIISQSVTTHVDLIRQFGSQTRVLTLWKSAFAAVSALATTLLAANNADSAAVRYVQAH